MGAALEQKQRGSVNWIMVILLGLVLPIAVVAVVSMMVTSAPRLPKGDPAALPKSGGAPSSTTATLAETPKPEPKVIAKSESNPSGRAEVIPAAPERKPETAGAPVKPAAVAAEGEKGRMVYTANCAVCHAAGVAGAPKLGDKVAWAPRLKEGAAMLHRMAIKGIRAMPPKGGNATLSDAEVKAAVDYMIAAAK
jgi:cytochrome c5